MAVHFIRITNEKGIEMQNILRQLPSVNELMQLINASHLSHEQIKDAIQEVLKETREGILSKDIQKVDLTKLQDQIEEHLRLKENQTLQPVINGTGTILHTNLGRSLLAKEAVEAVDRIVTNYSNLEYDLTKGERGSRYNYTKELLLELTGAEDVLVVNNNAAAVLLVLTTFAKGKEVLISRGELVEIGGSFRIPDVISSTGALLHEVGATNKTSLKDYEKGINDETGALLKVHPSNYQLIGFTEKPTDEELVTLAHEHNLPIFNDLGSGLLYDLQSFGLSYEPTIAQLVKAGYDLVMFSGDKLLGGPQAGIIVGKTKWINQLKKEPLLRALRVDKMTLAALEATLKLYKDPQTAFSQIPTLSMIQGQKVKEKAEQLVEKLNELPKVKGTLVQGTSKIGGGAYPADTLDSWHVCVEIEGFTANELAHALRGSQPSIISIIYNDHVHLDTRTLTQEDLTVIQTAIEKLTHKGAK